MINVVRGECHQGMGMPYQTWPSSQQLMYDLLLCDPEPHSRLNVPALDKDDLPGGDAVPKPTMMYKTSCVKSTCGRCGFNNRFPLLNNGVLVVEAGGRVCPIEWTEDPQKWWTWAAVSTGISNINTKENHNHKC